MNRLAADIRRSRAILVVDDAPINIGLVMDSLIVNGYSVLVAHDSDEALERAQFSQPDLILLDVRMPGIDGFETCRRLKLNPLTRDVPVVFMTSVSDTEDLVEGFAAGGVDYLTKPVRIAEMLARIETHIALRDLHNRLQKQNTLLTEENRVRQLAESALSLAHDQLEMRVAQRTAELAQANSSMRAEIARRKLTEAKLHASETRFRLIVETCPTPLCICSVLQGRVVFMNTPFLRLFNRHPDNEGVLYIADLFIDAAALDALFARIQSHSGFANEEVRLKGPAGATLWALATAQIATFDDTPVVYFGFNEVTTRKLAEEKLRASEASLANSQRLAKLGDWEWQAGSGTIHWSDAMYRILGLEPQWVKGSYRVLIHAIVPEDREALRSAVRVALGGRQRHQVDCRVANLDGTTNIVQFQAEATPATAGLPFKLTGTIQDITEIKRIEHELLASRERLRELSAYMEGVREEERKRIAMEIHDELGQLLTALKMDVALLKMHLGVDSDAAKKTDDMRELVEKTLWMVRNVASHLRPAALNFGVVSALEWLVEDFSRRNAVKGQFRMEGVEPTLPDIHATAIFRIAQASLTNVARHAGASRIDVSLTHGENMLVLRISDDGCGFEPAQARKGYSYGLLGMSERARLIGASLAIDSAPGTGTVVSINVPLEGLHAK